MIFTSDEVTSENHCRIASRVTKKSLFTVTNVLLYFLHAILCHEHTNSLRTLIELSFCHCCQGRPFLTMYCDVITCGVMRTRNTGIVTSSSIVIASANWRKDDLH